MNMDIFRGKQTESGEWIEGELQIIGTIVRSESGCFINGFRIVPETMGRFTRKCDRNGKRIFAGDIVRYSSTDSEMLGVIEEYDVEFIFKPKVGYGCPIPSSQDLVIIGNIFDNPDSF